MVTELASVEPISGLQEMRRGALLAHDKASLEARMEVLDEDIDCATFAALKTGLSKKAGRLDPMASRTKFQTAIPFNAKRIMRYAILPLDNRWAYHSSVRPLWNEPDGQSSAGRMSLSSLSGEMQSARVRENRATSPPRCPDYHLFVPTSFYSIRLANTPPDIADEATPQGNMFGGGQKGRKLPIFRTQHGRNRIAHH